MPKKTRRTAGKRVHRKHARKAAKTPSIPAARTHEELIVWRLSQPPSKVSLRGLEVQDLLYNSAEELRSLGFKAGFNLGVEAYKHSNGSMSSLEHVLEHAGFGKVVYYPFESSSIFYSGKVSAKGVNLGTCVHAFEAGIISGYLSVHSRRSIVADETVCVFNGSKYCRFIAHAGERPKEGKPIEFQSIALALQGTLVSASRPSGGSGYYMLAVKPLLEEPVFSEATKFLYITGKLLAGSRLLPDLQETVKRAANFMRIEKSGIRVGRKGDTTITLSFNHDTSSSRFVDLSVALLSGIVKGMSGRNMRMEKTLDSKGVYNVRLQVLGNPAR